MDRRRLAAAGVVLALASSAAAQDRHPTFAVGTATASRGQRAEGVIKVPAGSDAGYDIPVGRVLAVTPMITYWRGSPGDLTIDGETRQRNIKHNVLEFLTTPL